MVAVLPRFGLFFEVLRAVKVFPQGRADRGILPVQRHQRDLVPRGWAVEDLGNLRRFRHHREHPQRCGIHDRCDSRGDDRPLTTFFRVLVGLSAQFVPDEFGCKPRLILVFVELFVFSMQAFSAPSS